MTRIAWSSRILAASVAAITALVLSGTTGRTPAALAAPGSQQPTAATSADPTPGSNEFVITAPQMVATDLVYTGVATVTSGSATLSVMQFTVGSATFTGLTAMSPCVSGHAMATTVATSATATASGGLDLDATSLTMTIGGVSVTYTPSSPPAASAPAPLPTPLAVTSVTIVATYFSAAQFALPGVSTAPVTC